MTAYILRVFCAALICSIGILLCKNSSLSEIVRIVCACVMVIIILSFPRQLDLVPATLTQYTEALDQYIAQAQEQSKTQQYDLTQKNLEDHINRTAQSLDFDCVSRVALSQDGRYTVESVTVLYKKTDPAKELSLRQAVARDLGVSVQKIIFKAGG